MAQRLSSTALGADLCRCRALGACGGHVGGVYIAALCCLLLCARSLPRATRPPKPALAKPRTPATGSTSPCLEKKLQTLFTYTKILQWLSLAMKGASCVCVWMRAESPFCRVKCRISPDQMLYVKMPRRVSLLQIACGPGLGGCLAAADGDGCVDCDHLGEDVQDGLC